MPIHILSPEVANQIAAGEVVERPASAVKELIENSLDAGATDVRVEVREGGRRLLRVQDDGCGIPAAEVALAFERHATSKIVTAADLDHITTLGFRGEALASIAAVAQVTLLTRARDEEAGALIRLAEGREVTREPAGGPPGTIVTVEHLFANVPARLKFLKQPATEASHIQQIVTRYALAYPERRFNLVSDGKLVFQSTGSGKLYDVLVKVYGLEMAREMLPMKTKDEGRKTEDDRSSSLVLGLSSIGVTGYVGSPSLHRGNRGYITLFVNRRWFQDTSVAYSVIQAYHTMLPVGRYPVAVLFIEMDPADVDVNVHPTKAEVRFRDNHAVFSAVQKAVRRTVADLAPIPKVGLGGDASAATSPAAAWPGVTAFGGPAWSERRDVLLGAGSDDHRLFAAPGLGAEPPASSFQPGPPNPQSAISNPQSSKPLLPLLRVVGQLAATYVVAEGPDGMYLIDQHAAHERILYEQMSSQRAGHTLAVQSLLEPLLLDLSPEQAAVVAEELDTLNELGVGIEPFGGSSYLVRSIPAILSRENPAGALVEIVDGLASQNDVVEGTADAALTTLICKRAAIKGGHPLNMAEMQELVRQLEACRSPRTCPHGRPTMIYLSGDELARQFGRT
ncbi:MAG: DNA mismatch repair endonuclease MutL [Chloroflexi bacterium]|nr:DNA mismatch repair endonuclease MutL [Chloroflexota bacterium]